MDRAGLSVEERRALELEDGETDTGGKASSAEVEALEHELKKGDKDDDTDDADGKDAAAKAAEAEKAAAEAKAAEEKAAQEKREAELAAMSAEDRAKAEAADKEAKAAADKKAGKTDDEDAADEPFVPTYQAPAVEDYDGKAKALDDRVAKAEAAFKAGEKTFDEFRAEERAVDNERRKLEEARFKHEIATEQNEQMAQARWKWECDRFFRDAAKGEDGIDYKDPKNRALWAALDSEVKSLGKDPAHKDKAGPWFLEEADRRVREQFGRRDAAAPASGEKKGAAAVKDAKKERKDATPGAVRTLHGLPNAETDNPGAKDEFAHLDGLSGMELETALARMSKEDADRYLKG